MISLRHAMERLVAGELSAFSRYFDRVWQVARLPHDPGRLLGMIEAPAKAEAARIEDLPDLSGNPDDRSLILFNGVLNHHHDIQKLLTELKGRLGRGTRVAAVVYNPYLRLAYRLADKLGWRKASDPTTFLTREALANLARLAGFEVVRIRPVGYLPPEGGTPARWVNRLLPGVPVVRWLAWASIVLLRPVRAETRRPSLSVIIPARNERGNIENALRRMPQPGDTPVEVIFVEGHSDDGTWEEIQRVMPLYADRFRLSAYRQTGRGKNDAVRLGFAKATGELLAILDADLTVPPELLGRFYDGWCAGLGDFVNGNRLVYPMENEAMRFLNWCGNTFFAKAVGTVLDVPLGDCLCGTKVMTRRDYGRICDWRRDFGEFDPFGDFDFLFGAAELGLGILDMPIRYLARSYGETNISRFAHGWMLLQMTWIGFRRLLLGREAGPPCRVSEAASGGTT